MTTELISDNTNLFGQHHDAGLQAAVAEPIRLRTMADLINDYPGKAWYDAADRLAEWTESRLVNRTDAYRAYRFLDKRIPGQSLTFTAPWNEDSRSYGSLNREIIEEHYRGDQEKLIGLHAISVNNKSRWFVIDVDQHGNDGPVLTEENLWAAIEWYATLQALGFRPLLLDANGAGGYQLLVCLTEEVPSKVLHDFASAIVQDYAEYGLKKAPGVCPGEPEVNPHRPYGSWWRLPGRHHTNSHWTSVWDGDRWLEDQEAINAILSVTGDSPTLLPGYLDNRPS